MAVGENGEHAVWVRWDVEKGGGVVGERREMSRPSKGVKCAFSGNEQVLVGVVQNVRKEEKEAKNF
jgi:hypothetical protein